ncbi:MAG TPA: protein kinase [Gemmataceae bacterium]|nr:protein kinase [Gemmataceae bacterium]
MRAQVICPEHKTLKSLLDGSLSSELETQLTDHLSACGRCQKILESFTVGIVDDLGRQLQQDQETRSLSEGLQQAIQRLKDQTPIPETPEENDWNETMLLRSLAPSPIQGHLGRLGSYEIVEIIGRGGFGVVFKAFDPSLNRFVALKVLAPHLASNAAARKRFAREARSAAAVRDEHVVAIHNVEEANGLPYLVMEYISGLSLQQRLDLNGPLAVEEILRIGRQIAAGLAAAHAQGLIHRDIKPANILLENNVERVKITDFGLARAADDARLTQSGTLAGTPQYMAPEQARGEPLDHRADLFSLGSVLYALCTGRPPFRAASTLAVLRCIGEETPQPIRQINPAIPPWLEEIIAILQAKEPAQRFSSAAEVAELLGQFLTYLQLPGTAPRPALPSHVRRAGRNHSRRWFVAAVCLLGGFGLFASCQESKRVEAGHFYHDFRGRPIDTKSFLFTGPKARQQMTEEPEGLRITLPTPGTFSQATGLVANVRVSGDFEITTSYELLKADKPANSSVGVQLYIVMESPTQEAILFGRYHQTDLGHAYTCLRIGTDEEGKRRFIPTSYPTQTQAGRLRLTRKGSRVTCLAADTGSEDFQPLAEYELGTADLTVVRIAADTMGTNNPVVVRIGDFEIQASGAPLWRRAWPYLILAIFAIFMCAGGLWIWRRRRLKPAKPVMKPVVPVKPPPSKSVKKNLRQS